MPHAHTDRDDATPLHDNPIWQQQNVVLHSVGIDVGSSGTQVIFSRLHLRRMSENLISRYVIVERVPTYQSPVRFTPFREDGPIDAEALGSIIDDAYAAARQDPAAVDTGVVILTGEAIRRRNAARVARIIAERAGEFVCVTAGHHMEAMLAAHGSGAVRASMETGDPILNVDIGGGTTKLALVQRGRVVATAALRIGGRLQVVDEHGRLVRLEPDGRLHAARAGFTWVVGDRVLPGELDRVADGMVEALVAATARGALSVAVRRLYLTEPIEDRGGVAGVMFSGGVAEYIYGREDRDFGDLGRRLGAGICRRLADGAFPFGLVPAGERIRATAIGASQYSVQLSGSTGYISDPANLLPRRNLQVLRPTYELGERIDPDDVAAAIEKHIAAFVPIGSDDDIALALSWAGLPSHKRLLAFAQGLAGALADRISTGRPAYLVLDGDVARSLGTVLHDELGLRCDLLVIDGLNLLDFDYIDLGRLRQPSNTVPVTIKSLVFGGDDPRARTDTGSR